MCCYSSPLTPHEEDWSWNSLYGRRWRPGLINHLKRVLNGRSFHTMWEIHTEKSPGQSFLCPFLAFGKLKVDVRERVSFWVLSCHPAALFRCASLRSFASLSSLSKVKLLACYKLSSCTASSRLPLQPPHLLSLASPLLTLLPLIINLSLAASQRKARTRWGTWTFQRCRHPDPSMHCGRGELLDIAYWTLSEIRLGTSMLGETSFLRDAFDRPKGLCWVLHRSFPICPKSPCPHKVPELCPSAPPLKLVVKVL